MKTLDDLYLKILNAGILRIRNLCREKGSLKLIDIEAEHLHNIPSYIKESEVERHLYYLDGERLAYLKAINELDDTENKKFVIRHYRDIWQQMDDLVRNQNTSEKGLQ